MINHSRYLLKGIFYPRLLTLCMIAVTSAMLSSYAHAFSEDICYEYVNTSKTTYSDPINPVPFNCWDMECKDNINHSNTQCATTGVETYINAALLDKYHARNTLHFDVVWLIARMLGMTSQDAYTLAAYSQATDIGQYGHYYANGNPMPNTITDDIIGVQRSNFSSLGFWFHYIPWYRSTGMTETSSTLTYTSGGTPSPFASQEVPLNHLRAWAFGKRDSVCEFGITKNMNSDTAQCINDGGGTAAINYSIPVIADYRPPTSLWTLSWQRINPNSTTYGCTDPSTGKAIPCYNGGYTTNYANTNKGALKALGVYLHAMDDRLSHFLCVDSAYIEQSGSNYSLQYPAECGQVTHAVMHYAETGHSPVPERSINAIKYSYYEIKEWIAWKKTQTGGFATETVTNASNYPAVSDANMNSISDMIGKALTRGISRDRIKALCKIATRGYNLGWHDGNTECKY